MTQRNLRGAYVNFTHDRQADWDWLATWQPNVIRYMAPGSHTDPASVDVNRIRRLHETCPDATILLRVWDVDDRNFQAHEAMVGNPQAEAERQIDWWAKVFDRAVAANVPRDLLMAGLNNETGPEKDAALYIYTERALALATPRAIRLGVFVFSTGRPALAGDSPYDIARFGQLDAAILANRGAIILHEYLEPEGMYAVWKDAQGNERKDYTYLIGRHTRWQVQSPIIIGEWGIDGILYNRHPDPTYGNSGWRNFKADWPPSRYADEYVECIRQASDNVIGICPFISDFADHKWQSFDVLDAYGELLARKDLCVKQATAQPIQTHLPQIGTGPKPVEVQPVTTYSGIIDPLVAQAILNIESGGRAFGDDGRIIIRFEAHIFKTYLGNDALWAQYFRTDAARPWLSQEWRRSPADPWATLHTGNQGDEYAALSLALSLAPVVAYADAAYKSISMGAPQIMGFNHARIGYPSAEAMFDAFANVEMQIIGFINFCLSDPGLAEAMRNKDWRGVASRYNGSGQVDLYSGLLAKAYQQLGGA